MPTILVTTSPTAARASKERLTALSGAHIGLHSLPPLVVLIPISFPSVLLFMPLSTLLRIQSIIQVNFKPVCHPCLISIADFNTHVLGYAIEQLFAKLKEVVLTELLYLVRTFDFIGVTAGFYRERVNQTEVSEDSKPGTIALILLIAELAVVVLEVGGQVVQDHGEALDHRVVVYILIHGSVAKNGVLC